MAKNRLQHPLQLYRVSSGGRFRAADAATEPPRGAPDKPARKQLLATQLEQLDELQRKLYADRHHAVLVIFQAMDAAGKDSTVRAVFTGVDPAGCQVHAFKAPTSAELDHDFLWRTAQKLPPRGTIGVFNRSYYEEVLAVRVHPEYLAAQRLPQVPAAATLWKQRYASIRDHEQHLARNGTLILKFWLNVSREEQRKRLLARIDEPDKNWKFEAGDLRERGYWQRYMRAYEEMIAATSTPWAPWYAIPADSKSWMRLTVAQILVKSLEGLKLHYPELPPAQVAQLNKMKRKLSKRGG